MKSDAEYMREAYNIFLSLQKDVKACNGSMALVYAANCVTCGYELCQFIAGDLKSKDEMAEGLDESVGGL